MPERDLSPLSREELEAEVRRLRIKVRATSMDKARQNAIFDSALDFAMVVTDHAGVITGWNTGAEHITGWTADEMVGQDAARFFTPQDQADGRIAYEMQTALREGRASDERWHLRKGEQRFWASGEMMALRDDDETHIGFLKIMRDRTAEHLAGIALRETQERYRLASRATNDAVWDWDLTTNHVLWNEALTTTFGHAVAQIEPTGDWWISHIHPEDRARVDASIHAVIDGTGTAWTDEYRFQHSDGSYAEVLDRGHVSRDEDGKATRMIGAMLDLTQLRRAEAALRASEERFRTIVETIDAAFAIVKVKFDADDQPVDYRFVEANPAFERQAGVNLRGKWVTEFAPNLERFWFETYGHVAKTGEPATFESYAEAFKRWFDVRAVRVGDPTERQIAIFFNDATERHEHRETLEQRVTDRTAELMRAEELLRQSQKMEAVGQLTGGIAHDFNNLLAGISGSLELMSTRISQGRLKDVDKYMVAAQGATKRAAALTHRLLAFSRQQTLAPKAINVNTLVSGMLDLIQRTVGPSVELENVGAARLWPALVDPSQLENALLNLCINARDAMPEGGKVTIETANRWIDRHAAKQHDMPEGQYLSLCVSDTGTGMPPDVIAKAFDPFFTTKPIGQGTGLGLSMIYGFAKQSGGQVRIYSEMGEGTNVCIYLPRHRGKAETDEDLPEAGLQQVAEAGETVLIVDDEPTVRMLVTDVLSDLGYTAVEAADSAGGLKVLQSNARIDLLVTDVGLPGGMNGRQMADAARVGRPDLKILFITGFAENALLNNGQLEPGMSVLTKPFAVDTLAARIRELIIK